MIGQRSDEAVHDLALDFGGDGRQCTTKSEAYIVGYSVASGMGNGVTASGRRDAWSVAVPNGNRRAVDRREKARIRARWCNMCDMMLHV